MAEARVPLRFRPALERLSELDPGQRDVLVAELEKLDYFPPLATLRETLKGATDLDEDEATNAVVAVLSFLGQLPVWDAPPQEVARAVAYSKTLRIKDDAKREALADLINALLGVDAVRTTAKATEVATEHEHVFSGLRILTDLRPIFGEDTSTDPEGMTIVSMLKLDHHTDGEIRSIYVALDEEDLDIVRKDVERALDKVATLRSLMKNVDLPLYRSEGGGA